MAILFFQKYKSTYESTKTATPTSLDGWRLVALSFRKKPPPWRGEGSLGNNMTHELNDLKPFLRAYVETVTKRSKGGLYNCPLCGSGTGAKHTGAMGIFDDGKRWKCQSCNQGGDIFDLYAAVNRCDLSEATKGIIAMFGGGSSVKATAERKKPEIIGNQKPTTDFRVEIERYRTALPGSAGESYLQGRGFTRETMERFNLGYDADNKCVTIPYNPQGSYYGRRSVLPDAQRKHDNLKGVPIPVFNAAALYAGDVCFVVESPLCAISIAQEGGEAVAISGTSGKMRLVEQLRRRPTGAALVLCLDNDEAGRKASEEIGAALEEMGVFCVNGTVALMGDTQDAQDPAYRKDPNEVLQKSGASALRLAVEETAEETRRQYSMATQAADEDRQERTGAGMVDAFLQDIQTHKYEPMPTGISDIDKAIGGGFIRQQLILLGAAPGAGKTALAQWIFEGMAKRGISCVYLNLEMSREQILARSLARITAKNGQKIRATAILQGYAWTDEQRAAILEAAEEYKTEIAPRMIYNPDGVTANLDSIINYIEAEAQRAEKLNQAAPCVVLDYLQIVSGEAREDAATVIKRAVSSLKGYAMRHNTVVFVIIAHNRESNRTGEIGMESGRDTSALEYSADLQLGLTFTKCLTRNGQKGKSRDELTAEDKRHITLKITKGRFGGADTEVALHFNGETMTYSLDGDGFIETDAPTPWTKTAKRY